eukprot:TRINITY_DN74529_c0_g1_i1.p1 TRINITY_DN74529_c0_g1~~TRINITY_DN74529_c0_g1_i1.p1  ORF type:complete len:219 (-),score=12.10 TRINITY_DN74529_c0_g1_i1:318-974(-)
MTDRTPPRRSGYGAGIAARRRAVAGLEAATCTPYGSPERAIPSPPPNSVSSSGVSSHALRAVEWLIHVLWSLLARLLGLPRPEPQAATQPESSQPTATGAASTFEQRLAAEAFQSPPTSTSPEASAERAQLERQVAEQDAQLAQQRAELTRLRQLDNLISCKICYDNVATVVLLPCKHQSLCSTCVAAYFEQRRRARQPILCPICKQPVSQRLDSYLS